MPGAHRKTLELLPWYVNGTLPVGESESLSAHLRECLPCRAAYREELRLHQMLEEQGSVPLGQDSGLSNLLARIDRTGARRASVWSAFKVPGVALAATAAILVAGIVVLLPDRQMPASDEGEFSTLFGESDPGSRRLDVIFAEPLSADGLTEFLDSLGAVVAGGPTSLGRYTIEFGGDRDLDEIIDDLGSDSRVRFVGRSFTGAAPEAAAEQ